jgi:hypothetical protein
MHYGVGQFTPEKVGQFGAERVGQFAPERVDHFERNFHITPTNDRFSHYCL